MKISLVPGGSGDVGAGYPNQSPAQFGLCHAQVMVSQVSCMDLWSVTRATVGPATSLASSWSSIHWLHRFMYLYAQKNNAETIRFYSWLVLVGFKMYCIKIRMKEISFKRNFQEKEKKSQDDMILIP